MEGDDEIQPKPSALVKGMFRKTERYESRRSRCQGRSACSSPDCDYADLRALLRSSCLKAGDIFSIPLAVIPGFFATERQAETAFLLRRRFCELPLCPFQSGPKRPKRNRAMLFYPPNQLREKERAGGRRGSGHTREKAASRYFRHTETRDCGGGRR